VLYFVSALALLVAAVPSRWRSGHASRPGGRPRWSVVASTLTSLTARSAMPEHFDRNGRDAGLRPYQARQRCQAFARRPKLPGLASALASLAALGACGSEPEPQPPRMRSGR